MKIKQVRISGFRGIPPVNPPDVDLKFTRGQQIQDVIIFGPNAYGKSSIADALEWFFRERVRGSNYFENYTTEDNVHLNLGKANYPDHASIELVISHNGQDFTVKKSISSNGHKIESEENLAGLEAEFEKCLDEVIILDHDQFREFVSAASKDKWKTFSSLIGYEELDYFRAGLDSLTSRSVSDWLNLTKEKREVDFEKTKWQSDLKAIFLRFNLPSTSVSTEDLGVELIKELEIIASSLLIETPDSINKIDRAFWTNLRAKTRQPDVYIQKTQRLEELTNLSKSLPQLEPAFFTSLSDLINQLEKLTQSKSQFDKQLLFEFYNQGLEVMEKSQVPSEECPFCQTVFNWQQLQESVQQRLSELNLTQIQHELSSIQQNWLRLYQQVVQIIQGARLTSINNASKNIPEKDMVLNSLQLGSFDETIIQKWQKEVTDFNDLIKEQSSRIAVEKHTLESTPIDDAKAQLAEKISRVEEIWSALLTLQEQEGQIETKERAYQIKNDVVQKLRDIAKSFRDELSDFSGRVVQLINDDVDRYYDALHPNDGVKPFLETQISGNQRSVQLKCTYQGISNRDAATLLSESHRNSLGMAVMLAFMKYKRRSGSPIDFLVLDDVTQSFDVGHRLGLLDFLSDPNFPEIYDSQIIFLTHDRTLADLIVRPGELDDNWLRYDIRSWQLSNLKIEPNEGDLFARAKGHLTNGDDLAAAVYGRHALEYVYRNIVESANILMPYNAKPWSTKLTTYQKQITSHIETLWSEDLKVGSRQIKRGLINPNCIRNSQLNRSLRLLHLTVHDSDFLENPPAQQEIDTALQSVSALRDKFTCPTCRAKNKILFYPSLHRDAQGNPPICKQCGERFPGDVP